MRPIEQVLHLDVITMSGNLPIDYAHPCILPVGKGDPFIGVSIPLRSSIRKAEMLSEASFTR